LNFQENTANLLYKAVKRASVSPTSIKIGSLVVVTDADTDTVGVIQAIEPVGNFTNITLQTTSGIKSLLINDTNFVHILRKKAMLDINPHYQYERTDEKINKEVDMIKKNKGKHKERPDFSIENSEKSALPTSKISLSLRKGKEG